MNTESSPGDLFDEPQATLALWDWRRRIADLYADVRAMEPEFGRRHWVLTRDDLFKGHMQSPIAPERRSTYRGLAVFPYDPTLRTVADVVPAAGGVIGIPHSSDGVTKAIAFGVARFELQGQTFELTMYWLDEYGGGVFVPFRDLTNGHETYGGGRYLLDSAKGADLGHEGGMVVFDFNFAYHPSCFHDPMWSCPLSPPSNQLDFRIEAGERIG